VGLKLNGTHHLLFCVDDVSLLGDNIDTIKQNKETLINASKEVGLEVNTEETEYYVAVSSPECGQSHDIKIVNRCFENVAQFRYLGTTITNQNLIQEEIKRSLNLDNVCYHSIHTFCLFVCSLKT
jgi:hypothetical protein